MKLAKYVISAAVMCFPAWASDMVPAKAQSQPILIKGATLHTVSNGVKQNQDLLFENGKITQIGRNIRGGSNTKVINATGKHVYPGTIVLATTMGLTEIDAVRATDDRNEVGSINPEVKAHIPIIRILKLFLL